MMQYSDISSETTHKNAYTANYRNLKDESPPFGATKDTNRFCEYHEDRKNENQKCLFNGRFSKGKEITNSETPATIPIFTKYSRRKNSFGASCLNSNSSSPISGCYFNYGLKSPAKTQSLPSNTSIKHFNDIILNAIRVPADELANQITLLDFPIFSEIEPEELISCSWTKSDKHNITPNIVKFTRRFNHTSFWTVQEILSGDTVKQRSDILSHLIKVCKKLHELNNLHSLFAIISGMQSSSIYRLTKTWTCLHKKDKQLFDKLADIFSNKNNWENLRKYIESLRLPCIPYLGLFLTDLIFIDLAHPHSGGLESEQRRTKMNNILRVISNYQQSNYNHLVPVENTLSYLESIRYIEELQNMFEDDQYKKSCQLEPVINTNKECQATTVESLASLTLSPLKIVRQEGEAQHQERNMFIHRKCKSLGSNVFGKLSNQDQSFPQYDDINSFVPHPRNLLDDSSLSNEYSEKSISLIMQNKGMYEFQGCVRRKTILKEGKKPAVKSWQRYWLQMWSNSLIYFSPKSFKGSERNDFKKEHCKVCSLNGWKAEVLEGSKNKNVFELTNLEIGTVYKFRSECPRQWTYYIGNVTNAHAPKSLNLMSFE